MLQRDRLHVVALMLTALAAMFQCVGVLFPNWWVLKDSSMKNVVATFSLFGPVRCSDNLCFPEDTRVVTVPEGMTLPITVPDDNAAWLTAGRILSVIGVILTLAPIVLQLMFLKVSYRGLQLLANSFLITAAWLQVTKVFEVGGAVFAALAVACYVLSVFKNKWSVVLCRLFVCLMAGAGSAILVGIAVFAKKCAGLTRYPKRDTAGGRIDWPMGLSAVAAILCFVDAVVVGLFLRTKKTLSEMNLME